MSNKNKSVARRPTNVKKGNNQKPQSNKPNAARASPTSAQVTSITATWSAPIPPPGILAQYEAIVPGCAARIIEVANNQAVTTLEMQNTQNTHRIESEKKFLSGNERRAGIGQFFALLIAILELALAALLVINHYPIQGASVGGLVLIEGGVVWFLGGQAPRPDRNKG